jgi:hypothetical protein
MLISMNIILTALSIAGITALGFGALRAWRQKKHLAETDMHYGFRPRIGFTRLDGMASLSVLLENRFQKYIWAEEIEIVLSDLVAETQTAEPTLRGTQKIRQMVAPGDTLPISLSEVIYKAAGDPQREHSSVLTPVLRYRVGESWFEKQLDICKIRMMGLTATKVRRVRNPAYKNAASGKLKEVATTGTK